LKPVKQYFSLLILLLHFAFYTEAQNVPCFTTSAIKGCVPFTVTVDASCATNNSGTPPFYNYNYPAGSYVSQTTHTYTAPGIYTIRQLIGTSTIDHTVEAIDPAAPQFTVQSCSGRFVSAFIPDLTYDKYIVDFNDGSATQTVSTGSTVTHTYAMDGIKTVTVTGVFNPNQSCKSATQSTYARTSIIKPDIIDLRVIAQKTTVGSIILRYNSIAGQQYRIERSTNSGAYTTISTLPLATTNTTASYTDLNLNTAANVYEYKITSFDDCANTVSSDIIYSLIIAATPTNLLNTVTWNSSPAVASFALTKNSVLQTLTSPTTTTFADASIVCGTNYCYQNTATLLTTTLSGTPHKSYSIDTCITAISTNIPPAVTNLNTTMNGNTAAISWNSQGAASYKVYQSINGGAYTFTGTASTNSYSAIHQINNTYCYQIDYVDLCNNQSPKSSSACPVMIWGIVNGTSIQLTWNPYSGYDGTGVQSYIVQKVDAAGNVLSETNVGTGTSFSEAVNFNEPYLNYRIKVIPANASYQNVFSNNSIFTFEAQIFAPDIFTPNGDGSNETFVVKAQYIKTYSITIFSRWGEVVYASNDITQGWDGLDRNVRAIEGAYTYKIVATDIHDKEFVQTGTVTLTR
jgi:gliding motility-associated-like protein